MQLQKAENSISKSSWSGNSFDLLLAWAFRIIRSRYQQSLLGGLWAILQPAATVIIFTIIFTQIIPIDTRGTSYVLFSAVAMIPWTFFSSSITDMVGSLVENMNLVIKIYFPRQILPMAAMMARLVDFAIAAVMLIILMLIYRAPIFPQGLILLPVVVLIQMALALGIGLVGAALNVFYRDIKHIIGLVIQIWFYASPVIYPVERVPERFRDLYALNPMVGVISAYRNILLYEQMPDQTLWISAAVALVVLIFGYWFFQRVEFQFADVV